MIITGKHISRRAVLKGTLGATLALPFLDAMHPAMAAEAKTAAAPVPRLGIIYYPHGVVYERWTPSTPGPLKLTEGLAPLSDFTSRINIVSGLSSTPRRDLPEFHDRAIGTWLTATELSETRSAAAPSVDQLAARVIGKDTQLGSLELSADVPSDFGGTSFQGRNAPLPYEINPRVVFERLFGYGDQIDAKQLAQWRASDKSALDQMLEQIGALKQSLGAQDRLRIDQYGESIRDIERRLNIAAAKGQRTAPTASRPSGIPVDWTERVKVMMDLMVVAFQTDLTRVATFMIAGEGSGMSFPHLGISFQHHEASHHNYDPAKLDALARINVNQSELFAYFLAKMQSVNEAGGTLLDNSLLLFGSSLSNPAIHSQRDLPVMLAGGAGGRLKGGRFIQVPGDPPSWPFARGRQAHSPTPIANLHLTLLDLLGVPTEKFGDSTGRISL